MKRKPPNPLSGLSILIRVPPRGSGRTLYELRLRGSSQYPVGTEMAAREIERQLCQLYPAYNARALRKQMKLDPAYKAYEKARIDLATRYPDCGVPMTVL